MMVAQVQYTLARKELKDLFNRVYHEQTPEVIVRNQKEQVLLVRPDLARLALDELRFPVRKESGEGTVVMTVDLPDWDIVAWGPDEASARRQLVADLAEYAKDYLERLPLFLMAPNRRGHFGRVLRLVLADSEQEIEGLLQFRAT